MISGAKGILCLIPGDQLKLILLQNKKTAKQINFICFAIFQKKCMPSAYYFLQLKQGTYLI